MFEIFHNKIFKTKLKWKKQYAIKIWDPRLMKPFQNLKWPAILYYTRMIQILICIAILLNWHFPVCSVFIRIYNNWSHPTTCKEFSVFTSWQRKKKLLDSLKRLPTPFFKQVNDYDEINIHSQLPHSQQFNVWLRFLETEEQRNVSSFLCRHCVQRYKYLSSWLHYC